MAKTHKNNVPDGIIPISDNKRASFDFSIEQTFECGIVLKGSEIKSLRARQVNFNNAYAIAKENEIFLVGLSIKSYKQASFFDHDPERSRKLLLRKNQIKQILKLLAEKGKTLIPLKIYIKNGFAKVLIGVAMGKTKVDKRHDIKRREADIAVARVMRRGNRNE